MWLQAAFWFESIYNRGGCVLQLYSHMVIIIWWEFLQPLNLNNASHVSKNWLLLPWIMQLSVTLLVVQILTFLAAVTNNWTPSQFSLSGTDVDGRTPSFCSFYHWCEWQEALLLSTVSITNMNGFYISTLSLMWMVRNSGLATLVACNHWFILRIEYHL